MGYVGSWSQRLCLPPRVHSLCMYNPFLCVIVKSLSCTPSIPSCQSVKIYIHLFIVCVYTCVFTHVKFVELLDLWEMALCIPLLQRGSQGSNSSGQIWWQAVLCMMPSGQNPSWSELNTMWRRVQSLISVSGCGKSVGSCCVPRWCLYCVRRGCDRFPVTLVTKRSQLLEGLRAAKDCIQKVSVVVRISGSWTTWLGSYLQLATS